MEEFESPAYVLDLRDRSNCSRIQSAKPGQEIKVLVHPENDSSVPSILAKGTRSGDGTSFSVVVTTSAGEKEHSWNYQWLLEAIDHYQS